MRENPENWTSQEREEAAAVYSGDASDFRGDDDEPPPSDDPLRVPDSYRGVCGGCGARASASSPGGSCLWRGSSWHPDCRDADPDRPAILRGDLPNTPKEKRNG